MPDILNWGKNHSWGGHRSYYYWFAELECCLTAFCMFMFILIDYEYMSQASIFSGQS